MRGGELLSLWFGLSYASWLTMPRVMMQAMPDKWQGKMAKLLEEYDAAFPNQGDLELYVSARRKGKFVKLPPELCNYRRPNQKFIESCRKEPE